MTALDVFRRELRALLGPAVLLRRDRAMRALFICDAPRRMPDAAPLRAALTAAGYEIAEENGLWRIDLSAPRRAAWIGALLPGPAPEDPALRSLCRSLRAAETPAPQDQPWPPIRQTLLWLDAGETGALLRALSAEIAVCKRRHAPLPVAAACLIEHACTKEETVC